MKEHDFVRASERCAGKLRHHPTFAALVTPHVALKTRPGWRMARYALFRLMFSFMVAAGLMAGRLGIRRVVQTAASHWREARTVYLLPARFVAMFALQSVS